MNITLLPDVLAGDPEASAMLQAFYSRSHKPISERLEGIENDLPSIKKSLEKYLIGYGHASIGDCGDTALFIEGVSILAAKWIQNFPLYNGQETSTRYINFTKQDFFVDEKTPQLDDIIPSYLDFIDYLKPKVLDNLRELHPLSSGEDEKQWDRAINARCFDILRGFIPLGCKTQLSIKTSLRKFQDHFYALQHAQQLPEVVAIADKSLKILREKYPSSFYAEEDHRSKVSLEYEHCYATVLISPEKPSEDVKLRFVYGEDVSIPFTRSKNDPVPLLLDMLGDVYFDLNIDFGCWRDLQRHRRVYSPMPYVGVGIQDFSFNSWYLENLPSEVRSEAQEFLERQYNRVRTAYKNIPNVSSQYYMPLGTNVTTKHKAPLSAFIYMLELRSGKGVHPILRKLVHKLHDRLLVCLDANNIKTPQMYVDKSEDDFNLARGNSTILDSVGNPIA